MDKDIESAKFADGLIDAIAAGCGIGYVADQMPERLAMRLDGKRRILAPPAVASP
jgi:cyanate lyase